MLFRSYRLYRTDDGINWGSGKGVKEENKLVTRNYNELKKGSMNMDTDDFQIISYVIGIVPNKKKENNSEIVVYRFYKSN